MPYEFLPEVAMADMAFRATGKDLAEVFQSAADAVMHAMIDNLESIRPEREVHFRIENDQLDLLLFNVLNEILYYKDSEQLLLRIKEIQFDQDFRVADIRAYGEKLEPDRHHQRVDVKAITLHQFRLQKTESGWEAFVIVDV